MQQLTTYIQESLKELYPENEISGFSRIIIEHITHKPYRIIMLDKYEFSDQERDMATLIIERLKKYEPIQYILEETEFFGLPFSVNRHTLIPRPETEELVELIINENTKNDLSILDIGTGSGCIAIALAKHLKGSSIHAWDISAEAIDIARLNSKKNGVDIQFRNIDILSDYPTDSKFDIIVSNPPYVLESEKANMDSNVLNYEPHTALFVPDNKALLFYERIADVANNLLKSGGKLYFEINQAKGKETIEMLNQKGYLNTVLYKDMSGLDRMVKAETR